MSIFGNHRPTLRPATLTAGQPMSEVIQELWDFYQCMMQDEEIKERFAQYQTFKILSEDNSGKR